MANKMALEQKVNAILEKLETLATAEQLKAVNGRLDAHNIRFDRIDERFNSSDKRFDGIDDKLTKLEVGMDEVRSIAKLGLEAVQGLRETTDAGFAQMKHDFAG